MAPRRRGVRWCGAPLREAGGPRPRPAPCAVGDRRSAQVVFQAYDIGGSWSATAATSGRRSAAGGPSTTATARAGPRGRRGPAELLQARLRGHAAVAGAEAVAVVEALGTMDWPARRDERRPRRPPRPSLRRGRRLRRASGDARAVGGLLPSPARRPGRRARPPADLDAHQARLPAALEASGDGWLRPPGCVEGRTSARAS